MFECKNTKKLIDNLFNILAKDELEKKTTNFTLKTETDSIEQ